MTRSRFPLGSLVELKDPLPTDGTGPRKVVGVTLNTAPPRYKLQRADGGTGPHVIEADEGELQPHATAPARRA